MSRKKKVTSREVEKARAQLRDAIRNAPAAFEGQGSQVEMNPPATPATPANPPAEPSTAKSFKEGKTDQLNVRVTASLLAELRTLAKKHQVTVAAIVEAGCRHQIDKLRSRPAPPPL